VKVLQLCNKPPLPALDGGCIAMNNVTRGLIENQVKVKVICIFTHKHGFATAQLPADYVEATAIEGVFVDTRINMVDAFANFMTADSYNISRFFSTDFDISLTRVLQNNKFDVVLLESLFMTPYIATIRRYSRARVVLRSHNLEFVLWEKMASGTKNFARRAYLNYLSRKLKQYELSILNQVDGIAAISREDGKHFEKLGVKKPMTIIPFGVSSSDYESNESIENPETALFHIGAMDWAPNLEGIIWLLEKIWPVIHKKHPALKLYLAGRSMPDDMMRSNYPNVVFVGEVEDAKAFMHSKSIMIVPLLSGGGIRVKIIEGMACGKAIISTSIGAEGISCEHGHNILIADTPTQWLHTVEDLLKNPGKMQSIGHAAKELVKQHYSNTSIAANLVEFFRKLCEV